MRRALRRTEVQAAIELRTRVFCDEQGVPLAAAEDGRDDEAVHLIALFEGRLIGTIRILIEGTDARLGRLVVEREARGVGAGTALLEAAAGFCREAGARQMRLAAQTSARGLYDRAGFRSVGDLFSREGIEHVTMEKHLA